MIEVNDKWRGHLILSHPRQLEEILIASLMAAATFIIFFSR